MCGMMKQAQYSKIILRFGQGMTGCVMLLSAAGLFDTYGRHLELLSHFRFQYLLLALSGLILLLGMKSWKWSVVALGCVIMNTLFIAPLYIRCHDDVARRLSIPVRLLYANVNVANRHFSALRDLIQIEQPDILILLEPDSQWLKALAPLKVSYQYQHSISRSDGHGVMMYSHYPFSQIDIFYTHIGEFKLPTLLATLNLEHTKLTVLTTHPLPPMDDFRFWARNKQFCDLISLIKQTTSPKLVCGDFNVTMWSSYYREFLSATGLINARQGFGILPTWPTPHYYTIFARKFGVDGLRKRYAAGFNTVFSLPFARIPIDHCFVSSDIRIIHIRTGKDIGSDHLPLILDFAVATGQGRFPITQRGSES